MKKLAAILTLICVAKAEVSKEALENAESFPELIFNICEAMQDTTDPTMKRQAEIAKAHINTTKNCEDKADFLSHRNTILALMRQHGATSTTNPFVQALVAKERIAKGIADMLALFDQQISTVRTMYRGHEAWPAMEEYIAKLRARITDRPNVALFREMLDELSVSSLPFKTQMLIALYNIWIDYNNLNAQCKKIMKQKAAEKLAARLAAALPAPIEAPKMPTVAAKTEAVPNKPATEPTKVTATLQ